MKKKYLVWGAIATIVGIGYYYWNKGKGERQRRKKEANDVLNATPPTESGGQANNSNLGSSTQGSGVGKNPDAVTMEEWNKPTGFTEAQGNQFRAWFNDNYPELAKAFDLDRTGKPDNATIRKVYYKYKGEWNKFISTQTQAGQTATLAKLNKDTMDKLYMTWGGNSSAKKGTHPQGRSLQVFFEVGGEYFMAYKWSIIFFEFAKGESRPTYAITDGQGKNYQRGYFSFDGKTYNFTATTGTGKTRKATSVNLVSALNILTDRSTSLA